MSTDTVTTTPLADAVTAAVAEAVAALDAARELAASAAERVATGTLSPVTEAETLLCRELYRAAERADRAAAGMGDEPSWHDCGGIFDAVDDAWNLTVVEPDERYPRVEVDAADAVEANRRAITWATLTAGLPSPLPADSAYLRARGDGTREVSPGRWTVTVEGW